jgi:segregation and condensation protein B
MIRERWPLIARKTACRPMSHRIGDTPRRLIHEFIELTKSGVVESENLLGRDEKLSRVEALLMLADEPLTSKKIAEVADLSDGHEARRVVETLREFYDAEQSPFTVVDIAGGFQLLTRPAYHYWLIRLQRTGYDLRLTSAAMETLTVVAYKQPIMKAAIEAIRGVSCGELLHILMEKGLIRITGRHDSLGRPQLYGTTKKFLQVFGLRSIEDLPTSGTFA